MSLVFVHGATDESQSGAVTFTVGGLPEEAEWAVKDDKYDAEGNYDDWTREDERVRIDWTWKANRTDGGAYEGLGEEFTVTVDPAFNEDAELYGQQGEGTVENWMALSHVDEDHEDHESTYLDLTEPVVVSTESCEDLETATDELPDGDTAGGDGDADDPDGNDKEDESDDGDDED